MRYQDVHQEYHAQQIRWQTVGMQLADVYSMWSATNVIQMLSEHTRDKQEYKKYLGLGQKASISMLRDTEWIRRKHIGMLTLGVLIELHKQLTAWRRWQQKATPTTDMQVQQHVQRYENIGNDLLRIADVIPKHKDRACLKQASIGMQVLS